MNKLKEFQRKKFNNYNKDKEYICVNTEKTPI